MGRCAQAQNLRHCEAKHHPRLGVIWQNLFGLAVDESIQINRPAQSLLRDRNRQGAIRWRQALGRVGGGLVHRRAHAHDGIKQPQGGTAGGQARNFVSHDQAH